MKVIRQDDYRIYIEGVALAAMLYGMA